MKKIRLITVYPDVKSTLDPFRRIEDFVTSEEFIALIMLNNVALGDQEQTVKRGGIITLLFKDNIQCAFFMHLFVDNKIPFKAQIGYIDDNEFERW